MFRFWMKSCCCEELFEDTEQCFEMQYTTTFSTVVIKTAAANCSCQVHELFISPCTKLKSQGGIVNVFQKLPFPSLLLFSCIGQKIVEFYPITETSFFSKSISSINLKILRRMLSETIAKLSCNIIKLMLWTWEENTNLEKNAERGPKLALRKDMSEEFFEPERRFQTIWY